MKAHRDDFRNMLIWGDNKLVIASLLKDFKGEIDLVYTEFGKLIVRKMNQLHLNGG